MASTIQSSEIVTAQGRLSGDLVGGGDPMVDAAEAAHQQARAAHWDSFAERLGSNNWHGWGSYYHHRMRQVYRLLIPPHRRVLEIGCGRGSLLGAVEPALGVGVDLSGRMLDLARERFPQMRFVEADAHELDLGEQFDYVIISDLVNELWDVQRVFERVAQHCTPRTRLIINTYSRLWELPLAVAKRFKLAKPELRQNWLTVHDVQNLLTLTGFETIRSWQEVIWPVRTPLLNPLFNKLLVRLPVFRHLALSNFVMARPVALHPPMEREPVVSVIVPARNEAGNVEQIFDRVPEMGAGTEIVFVEGHSKDNTYETIEHAIEAHPERRCRLMRQTGKGKGDAVRLGYAEAAGDVLMILDADLTVPPEDLPRFYEAIRGNRGEFINGVRLVYPMQDESMRFLNLLGNKFFSLVFSWLLSQPIKDSLCGTKVLWKQDYQLIADNRAYFGNFDPFGDFDLLFGAAKQNLKIVDLPIRYRERTYGTTQIDRWRHGWMLLKMAGFAATRVKFV